MQAPVISALALVLILSGVFTVAAGNDLSFVMKILDYFDMPAFSTDVVHTGAAVCLSLLASITSVVMWALVGSKIGVVLNHRFGRD
jgi:predicted cobalt transporter CbtA